jgi:hypothetical protein
MCCALCAIDPPCGGGGVDKEEGHANAGRAHGGRRGLSCSWARKKGTASQSEGGHLTDAVTASCSQMADGAGWTQTGFIHSRGLAVSSRAPDHKHVLVKCQADHGLNYGTQSDKLRPSGPSAEPRVSPSSGDYRLGINPQRSPPARTTHREAPQRLRHVRRGPGLRRPRSDEPPPPATRTSTPNTTRAPWNSVPPIHHRTSSDIQKTGSFPAVVRKLSVAVAFLPCIPESILKAESKPGVWAYPSESGQVHPF